jgi:CRISPR-associated protein Cmr4
MMIRIAGTALGWRFGGSGILQRIGLGARREEEVQDLITNTKIYWLHAITPLHVGAGKGVGFIDMPIMREKVTNWPLVPGSAVKGVLRDHFTQNGTDEQRDLVDAAFGKQVVDDASNAGSLVLTDAHIVCLPVRSLYGTFAYITSPLVLERLKRDLTDAGHDIQDSPEPGSSEALHITGSKLVECGKIFFEDIDFTAKPDDALTKKWGETIAEQLFSKESGWQAIFKERFAVISDDNFNFLAQTGTEVVAHVRIEDSKKIVAKGALWYEEALPAETVLAGIAWCDRVFGSSETKQDKILSTYCQGDALNLQIGGKATVGKGRARCLFTGGNGHGK